jgi:uncharacterized protein YkwD
MRGLISANDVTRGQGTMARKRGFRPSGMDVHEGLEPRLSLSQAAVHHLFFPFADHGEVFRVVARRGHGPHGKAAKHQFPKGPRAQSNPTSPIIVVTLPSTTTTTPVASPPVSSPPVQAPPSTVPPAGIPTVPGVMSATEQTIVDLVNQQRGLAGLAPLQGNSRLVKAAQIHSSDMARLGQMEHTLPGAALPALEDRAGYVGYSYSYLGENIAFNFRDDNSVMNAWMNSSGHRANILNPNYTQIGVGIAYDGQGQPYYTQEFGKPA